MMVVVKFYYISKAFQCVNVCGHVFWRQFAVVYGSCQRREGIRSISVRVCMCLKEGQKGTSNRKASGALPGQGLLETDFTRPSVQKKPSFW